MKNKIRERLPNHFVTHLMAIDEDLGRAARNLSKAAGFIEDARTKEELGEAWMVLDALRRNTVHTLIRKTEGRVV